MLINGQLKSEKYFCVHFALSRTGTKRGIRIGVPQENNKNFGHVLRTIFYTYCYYNFNTWGIFEYLTLFSLIRNQALKQGQVRAAVNSRNKSPNKITSNVRNRLKFRKICKKVILYTKI